MSTLNLLAPAMGSVHPPPGYVAVPLKGVVLVHPDGCTWPV